MAHGRDPSPPASDTAIARSVPLEPAIGAWMIGSSIPRSSVNLDRTSTPSALP
jgi:hypothetical protein